MTEIRRFAWDKLTPDDRATMIELVRSLGLDAALIAVDFALTRTGDDPWRLHLTHFEPNGRGGIVLDVAADREASRALVFDGVTLPAFLTTEETGPDCPTCSDSGLAVVGQQFNGRPVHADCPDCGVGAEKRVEADRG